MRLCWMMPVERWPAYWLLFDGASASFGNILIARRTVGFRRMVRPLSGLAGADPCRVARFAVLGPLLSADRQLLSAQRFGLLPRLTPGQGFRLRSRRATIARGQP